jgi:hypothetical protein
MRLAIAFVVVVVAVSLTACPKKGGGTATPGAGSGSGSSTSVLAKKIFVHFGFEQSGSSAQVYLQTTDEVGKQVSHPLGSFKGACATSTPVAEMKALTGAQCKEGATGTELHAVVQGGHIIVLKMMFADGATPDPMAREEITRVAIPSGAAVSAD